MRWKPGAGLRRSVLMTLAIAALVATACSPLYVLRAGAAESRILSRRRPIAEVIRDPSTTDADREKLRLVTEARNYARHVLDLNAGNSFRSYSWVESDTLLLVVSGARKDRFEPYTWWFPIVGRVPYKGFFDFDAAHRQAERLAAEGYDTYVRPTGAFSTLGWFNDPLLNTVLRYDDVDLVSTVIHELLHNTLFIPSQISFNESFASFVGDRGTIEFFCMRDGETSENCARARDAWADNLLYGGFISDLIERLETLYARADLDSDAKVRKREVVFTDARTRFARDVEPGLRTSAFRSFPRRTLNNATLIGIRLYYHRLDLFEAAYQRLGGDLIASIAAIDSVAHAGARDPFAALARLAGATERKPVP
jgi:predicted aminopeptidase